MSSNDMRESALLDGVDDEWSKRFSESLCDLVSLLDDDTLDGQSSVVDIASDDYYTPAIQLFALAGGGAIGHK
jgi:hypothetical protein